ncbi:MAG: type II secretion system protein [Planctomycetota bacterium]|jgi:general secretion pathway protein G
MKKGFSLVEVLIVLAILGILAAAVVPQFQSHAAGAKETTARNNLQVLRNAIELYVARNGGVAPGYPDNNPAETPSMGAFFLQMVKDGDYLTHMPENPFNNQRLMQVLADADTFGADATGAFGWIYKPATREVRLDWPGTDDKGTRYYDY